MRCLLLLPLLITPTDTATLTYTREEANSYAKQGADGNEHGVSFKPPKIEIDLEVWLSRTGRKPPERGYFRINAAQEIAGEFCRNAIEKGKNRKCSWTEYNSVVERLLLPFQGTFNHNHFQGVIDQNDLASSIDRQKRATHTEMTAESENNIEAPEPKPCTVLDSPPSAAVFLQYVQQSQPFVLRNAVKHWPAIQKWTKDYLASILPQELEWPVAMTPHGQFDCVEPLELWTNYGNLTNILNLVNEDVHVLVRPATMSLTTKELLKVVGNKRKKKPRLQENKEGAEYKEQSLFFYVEYFAVPMLQDLLTKHRTDSDAKLFSDVSGAFDAAESTGRLEDFDLSFASFVRCILLSASLLKLTAC